MIERRELRILVDDILDGVAALAATTIIDQDRAGQRPVLLCCFAGGGSSSGYFELDGFDMTRYLAEAGFAVTLFDHPAIRNSDTPNDPWLLAPETVAAIEVSAVRRLVDGLGFEPSAVIGLGHSMGSMLVAYQQYVAGEALLYDGVALLGYSGRGIPEVLDATEREVADDPDRVRETVTALARHRFGVPLVTGGSDASEMLTGAEPPPGAIAALAKTGAPLLAVCGMATLLPGAHARPLASIKVPVLFAVGEHDIVGPPDELPGYVRASSDVQVEVVPGAYHNSNVAPAREQLWDRVARWARELPASA